MAERRESVLCQNPCTGASVARHHGTGEERWLPCERCDASMGGRAVRCRNRCVPTAVQWILAGSPRVDAKGPSVACVMWVHVSLTAFRDVAYMLALSGEASLPFAGLADEAGRGPSLGPMVYGVAACRVSDVAYLAKQNYAGACTAGSSRRGDEREGESLAHLWGREERFC